MSEAQESMDLVAALLGDEELYSGTVQELHEYSLGEDGGRCHEIVVDCGAGP